MRTYNLYQVDAFTDTLFTGNPAGVDCIRTTGGSATSGSTKGAASYGGFAITAPAGAFYRITARVKGPRNTISYVQATVY